MSPLLYLLLCRIKNGIYRSFKTPVRGFMTVLIGGYLIFALAAFLGLSVRPVRLPAGTAPTDPRIALAFFTLAHLLLFVFVVPPPRYVLTIVSEVDIANLYPTPLERWRVVRFFLSTRSLVSLFFFVGLLIVYLPFLLRLALPSLVATIDIGTHPVRLVLHILFVLIALAGLLLWRLVIDVRRDFGLLWSAVEQQAAARGLDEDRGLAPSAGAERVAGADEGHAAHGASRRSMTSWNAPPA